ncbi:MAG: benzoate-CoA ligase family protein [Roseibium sp.]
MNLARYCLTRAAPDPEKTALEVIGPGGEVLERWRYGALTDAVLSVAAGLTAAGLRRGDRVLLRIGHSSDFPLLFFGAIAAGIVPVPTSPQLTPSETGVILADSGAALILHDGTTSLPAGTAVPALGPEDIRALKQAPSGAFAETDPDDPAFLIYTSGTSGTPKGVLHAQRAAAARRPMDRGWYGITAEDRLLHAGAFNWTYTLGVGLMDPWANGATSIVYDGPRDPELWPGVIEASGATLFAAVPSLYRRILKYGEVTPQSFPALRHGLTAGEALPAALYHDWKHRSGRELYEALGMSEISTYLSSGPDVPVVPGSPGKPQAGRKVAILREDGEGEVFAGAGDTGLLAVHRDEPGLMLGYWNRPDETRAAFRGDWFLTGDRARADKDGYYWYEGRADDLMNAFGYRVAPEEVERVLAADPQVQEVAVTAVSTREGVSLITAFVVPADLETFDENRLAAHAAANLAEYKRPKVYEVLDQLPRTPSGKTRRAALRTRSLS